jgi:regulator of RNase E activity RraA
VIDGGVRDLREIKEIEFPVFARSITPAAGGIFWPGSINTTVTCGGVTVNAGDIVVGDEDGVVVVPKQHADAILTASNAIVDREKKIEEDIDRGVSLVDILKLTDRLRPNLGIYPTSIRESIANWIKEKEQ